ncbi:DUF6279 family lipoprotein [Wenzhouxiangella sp. XN24]|uniref:DUF6279 family lipoprotein n=1 Tax=Wenzhouxiangella sp. XN24 TaxID=2713569 RepID=UPI0013EBBDDF|nr:DUF6279 family lipoprotein [Wenzhouxiangella sp. XN24]NGX16543.1 hypothetical protein [Wenzhouxiangella sp. XN24]
MIDLRRVLLLVLGLTLFVGCSTRLAYDNLDWFTVRWVDQQVSLDEAQRTLLRDVIEAQQLWHCATQLDDYQAWIEEARLDLLADRLDQQRLAEHGERLAEFGRTLAQRIQPVLVELATSLDDQQVEEVLSSLDDRIAELRDEIESDSTDQWAQQRAEGMERGLRRFMGRINAPQRDRLERWARELEPTRTYQLAQRVYWRDRIAGALARRDDRAFLEQEVAALLEPSSVWPESYRQAIEANRGRTLAALEEVFALMEPKQRARLSSRLVRLGNDFERLSCEGEAPLAKLSVSREPPESPGAGLGRAHGVALPRVALPQIKTPASFLAGAVFAVR